MTLSHDPPSDSVGSANDQLDQRVRNCFGAWDGCHLSLAAMRKEYDVAMRRFEQSAGPDPVALRQRMKTLQAEGDNLFFAFLRAAEARTRDRYI